MDELALDDAAAAAAAELAPVAARLGVYGLNLEILLAATVRAAAGVLVAHHDDTCPAAHRVELEELDGMLVTVAGERDAARLEAVVLAGQREELAGQLLAAQAETSAAAARAGQLAGALVSIEALPYEGAEPPARRIAREALA